MALKIWNKHCFGHIQSQIKDLNHSLMTVQSEDMTPLTNEKEEAIKFKLNEMLKREYILWKQKFRLQWLTTTNLNTKFFHMTTTMRRRKNSIECIRTNPHQWINNLKEIENIFLDHFTLSTPIQTLISPLITAQDNTFLYKIPSKDEIWQTLRSTLHQKPQDLTGSPSFSLCIIGIF